MTSRRRVLAMLAALATLGAGLAAPPARAATHDVTIVDNAYNPGTLRVQPGDTVRWTATRPGHTVTATDGRFDFHPARTLDVGEQVSWTAGGEDEFVRYFCRVHAGMAGVIQVGDPPVEPVPSGPTLVVPDQVGTVGAAVAAAEPGTEILIRPGVYPESITVATRRLTLRGMGDHPEDVVLDGGHVRDAAVTVAAPEVKIANLAVTGYRSAGIVVDGASGTVIENAVLDGSGLYGIDARAPAGMTVRAVRARGHGVAGVGLRDCAACGTLIDSAQLESNAAGVAAAGVTGLVVRGSRISGNAVGLVLRDTAGAQVTGNTLTDNDATDVWVASVFDRPEPPSGAGVWMIGGRANLVAANTLTGHTYNVAVTGPAPALQHRVADNTVGDAEFADLAWDGLGAGVCFSGNRHLSGGSPTSDPLMAQTVFGCSLPTTVGVPYPIVTANLTAHARSAGYPV